MGTNEVPSPAVSTAELLKLARRIERHAAQRRKLLAKVGELEGSIREARRMFRQLAESLGVDVVREQLADELRESPGDGA
jgi:hypothetical protein